MRYLSVAEIAPGGMCQSAVSEIISCPGREWCVFTGKRHGTFQKTQKNRSVPIKEKQGRSLCWIF